MFFGDIVHWWYKELNGIRPDPDNAGFRHFYIQPFFPESLEHAAASHDCMYGLIRSEWKRNGESITLVVEIPANTSSTIILPGGKLLINGQQVKNSDQAKNFKTRGKSQQFELGSGTYHLDLTN